MSSLPGTPLRIGGPAHLPRPPRKTCSDVVRRGLQPRAVGRGGSGARRCADAPGRREHGDGRRVSWALLEPEEGRFEFGRLDAVLDRLHANGVRGLATPTAFPPPWFTLAYPDAMPVTCDGTRLWHGSRDTYCAAAPSTGGRRCGSRANSPPVRRSPGAGHVARAQRIRDAAAGATTRRPGFRRWLRARYGDGDRGRRR